MSSKAVINNGVRIPKLKKRSIGYGLELFMISVLQMTATNWKHTWKNEPEVYFFHVFIFISSLGRYEIVRIDVFSKNAKILG